MGRARSHVSHSPTTISGTQSVASAMRLVFMRQDTELLQQSHEVLRAIGPDGTRIERDELDAHYDEGRFPGLRRSSAEITARR